LNADVAQLKRPICWARKDVKLIIRQVVGIFLDKLGLSEEANAI
jgi:hypothetical protein